MNKNATLKKLSVRVPHSLWKEIKTHCLDQETSISALILAMIERDFPQKEEKKEESVTL